MLKVVKLCLSLILVSMLLIMNLIAQSKTNINNNIKNTVVAKVGPEQITYEKLEKAFTKNMNRANVDLKDIPIDSTLDFLNLFVKYRLKVLDALDRGFDKDSSVIADIEQNRKILAESYYYEKKLMNPWIERMLKYRNWEYKIAVMVFAFPPSQNPDTLPAYTKGMNCLKLLKQGEDFREIALDSSDDPETRQYGGEVKTWITAGSVQRPLEQIILTLDKGQYYPELIRTRFGYFILKLIDKQPRKYVKSSHILLTYSEEDSVEIFTTANEILKKLKNGEDFAKLAREYSKDNQTALDGGELKGFYSRTTGFEKTGRRLVPAYEDALFNLKDGEISDLVITVYGVHIIKRDVSKDPDPEIEIKDLKSIYRRSYYEEDKKVFLDSLHKTYGFKVNDNVLNEILSYLDTNKTTLQENWFEKIPAKLLSNELFTFMDKSTSIGEFIKLLSEKPELKATSTNKDGLLKAIDKIISPLILKEATKYLEKEYPEFNDLMSEFRDGILLFKVEQIEVWDNLKFDSTKAKVYWDSTKSRYITKPKYDISEIYVLNDSIANEIYKKIQNGEDFDELAKINTERSGYREKKGYWGELDTTHALVKLLLENNLKSGEISKPLKFEKGYSLIRYNKFVPSRQKSFEEAIPDFAAQFQELMQKQFQDQWIERIKKKFPVEIYKDKISKVNKILNNKKR